MFAHYYQRYPSFLNARSAADVSDQEQLTREAFESFNHKEFKTAKKHFMELLQSDKNNHLAKFYLAVSCIELNDFSHAERYLEELTHTPNHIFWEQSHWYLSLVYLKQEKYDEAEQILRTIVNEQFINFSDAEEILKQMD
ncbi:MAG: tetratricopeptide repeat protein [Bacteroidota bacterium]|nr:tetratricopeptide repeat protein [Bacteroidota bacterium]